MRPVLGLPFGEVLIGIDVRPATGELYALGAQSRLYSVDARTGFASPIGAGFTPALSGAHFGFDFNPTVDRIRVVSDTGQNLRLHPTTGLVVAMDGGLAFAPGDVNAGAIPSIGGAGYTNSMAGATTTVLYDVDAAADVLVTQIPPNSGVLNTVGALGIDVSSAHGFDVAADTGFAFGAFSVQGGPPALYRVTLATGSAVSLGGLGVPAVMGLALLPRASAQLVAVGGANDLVFLDAAAPGAPLFTLPVTGLPMGETLVGVDVRPLTGELYALGATSRLYVIDTTTGAAVQIGGIFSTLLSGTRFGFDFNPTVDRIRVVSDTGQNLRLHPTTGAVVFVDGALSFAVTDVNAGQIPDVVAGAYVHSVAGTTNTVLYDIDLTRDVLLTQIPPNSGTLNTVGALGVDATGTAGFDISGLDGTAYAALTPTVGATGLYRVNLATGQAAFLGALGFGAVRGLAVLEFPGMRRFGRGFAGTTGVPGLGTNGAARIGRSNLLLAAANAAPSTFGIAAFSDLPLGVPAFAGSAPIFVDVNSAFATFAPFFTDAFGEADFSFAIPNDPLMVGAQVVLQMAFLDGGAAGGISATTALSVVVQP